MKRLKINFKHIRYEQLSLMVEYRQSNKVKTVIFDPAFSKERMDNKIGTILSCHNYFDLEKYVKQ